MYSIKRVFDPKVRSYWLYMFEQTLVGLEGPLERARKSGKFDYDEKIEGLQALDRYTLRIRFKQPDLRLQMVADDVELRGGRARSRREVPGRLRIA